MFDEIRTEFRPAPFWSWNDKLETEELRWQIREMKKAGIGGFFMHARGGLQTEYLSSDWMECVAACLDEAGKQGMNAWLYDENGWPSGFGGGLVNGMGEQYQQKYLRCETGRAGELLGKPHTIAFYKPDSFEMLYEEEIAADNVVLRFYYDVNPYYVDNLDSEVVANFLKVTHQQYYEKLPKELLAHLKGIFTDEPQLSRNGFPWSLTLPEKYQEEYGRDILADLPGLFNNIAGYAQTRVRFWRLCAILFNKNFMKQIRDWCDEHGWMLTGHHVLEEVCTHQILANGSIMAQYQYYSIPGIDKLGRTLPWNTLMVQVASAAAQFGHKQILTESFACTGWNCNFTGQRHIYLTQLAHGMNFLCQHLQGYSLRGLRKRDYPSSAFYHQPWWNDYKEMNDYFSFVGQNLADGRHCVDTLVLHTLSSVWVAMNDSLDSPELAYYTDVLENLSKKLDASFIDHHFADEVIAERYGAFRNGAIQIGLQSYRRVIIPPIINTSRKMYSLLKSLEAAGGLVIRMRNANYNGPLLIDGAFANAAEQAWFDALPTVETAEQAVFEVVKDSAELPVILENGIPAQNIVGTSREISYKGMNGRLYFFVNNSYEEKSRLRISLPATGIHVTRVDNHVFEELSGVRAVNGRIVFDYCLAGSDAVMLLVTSKQVAEKKVEQLLPFTENVIKAVPVRMKVTACDDNLLTLDRCRYSVDGGEWVSAEVISIHSRLLTLRKNVTLRMQFDFNVAEEFDLDTPLTLVTELPENFTVALNGTPVKMQDKGYIFDKAFRRIELPKSLRTGINTIEMEMKYHQPDEVFRNIEAAKKFESEYNKMTFDSEVESIYLAGNFSVRHTGDVETLPKHATRCNGTFEIASPSAEVDASNIVLNGYPFFAGNISLEAELELTQDEADTAKVLRFSPEGANSWKVAVNGIPQGDFFWGPYGVVLKPGAFIAGRNIIAFTITTSLRNMLGPHHLEEGESYGIGTLSFNIEPNFADKEAPKTVKGYSFVNIGVSQVTINN